MESSDSELFEDDFIVYLRERERERERDRERERESEREREADIHRESYSNQNF